MKFLKFDEIDSTNNYMKENISSFKNYDIVKRDYPQDVDGTAVGSNRDPHTVYYGEIVAAYIIEE